MEPLRHLNKRMQTICDAIVHHVFQTSPQRYEIVRMRLVFKADINGKFWLMFCQQINFKKSSDNPFEERATTSVVAKPAWMEKQKKTWETINIPAPPKGSTLVAAESSFDKTGHGHGGGEGGGAGDKLSMLSIREDHGGAGGADGGAEEGVPGAETSGRSLGTRARSGAAAGGLATGSMVRTPKIEVTIHQPLPPRGPLPLSPRRTVAPRPDRTDMRPDGRRAAHREWPELSMSRHTKPLPMVIKKACPALTPPPCSAWCRLRHF